MRPPRPWVHIRDARGSCLTVGGVAAGSRAALAPCGAEAGDSGSGPNDRQQFLITSYAAEDNTGYPS